MLHEGAAPPPAGAAASSSSSRDAAATALPRNNSSQHSLAADECFLCCDDGRGPLIKNVCHCRGISMHLECQKRMLEAAYAARGAASPTPRCGVCHAVYRNAGTRSVWRLSMLGALWCTCCAGVIVMWWSGSTVLDRGSSQDPKLDYLSLPWWDFTVHNFTWWRLVGLLYIAISLCMASVAVGWLLLDLFGAQTIGLAPAEPLCIKRYLFHVWHPDEGDSPLERIRNLLLKTKFFNRAGFGKDGSRTGAASSRTAGDTVLL
jgi:hypothetical protein